jgi:hypothetical protein
LEFALEKYTEALSATSKNSGVEVNVEKSKYMFISHNQNNGKNYNTRITKSIKNVAKLKCLVMIATGQNCSQKEINT